MNAVRKQVVIQQDGVLQLDNLPFRRGDIIEAVLQPASTPSDEQRRALARERFLAIATASKFRSTGPYPKRDELYDRPCTKMSFP